MLPIEGFPLLLKHVNIGLNMKEVIEHLQGEAEAFRNVDIRIGVSNNVMLFIKVALNVSHPLKELVPDPQI